MVNTDKIPQYQNRETLYHVDGDTQDIIDTILEVDGWDNKDFCGFARQFNDGINGLQRLWTFVKYQIRYKTDGFGRQDIKTPAHLWAIKVGDCKSKTLFVNQILRCLGIPYKIRFTKYRNNADFTHVYTLAKVDGAWIPIDTVYSQFGKEQAFTANKDYDMARIAVLSGLESELEVQKGLEEIRQKQAAAPQEQYIDFGSITDGEAEALILKRQVELLGAMNPEKKALYAEGAKMIDKVMVGVKGRGIYGNGNAITSAPEGLQNLAIRLNNLQNSAKAQRPALSFGLDAAQIMANQIGAATDLCGGVAWAAGTQPNQQIIAAYTGVIPSLIVGMIDAGNNVFQGNTYRYGMGTPYQKTSASVLPQFQALATQYINANKAQYLNGSQNGALYFASQKCREAFLDELKVRSGVLTAYVNDVMQSSRKGTTGTGVLYNFCTKVKNAQGQPLSLNTYPSAVVAKQVLQSQWVGGINFFSGVSLTNVELMAKNGVILDSGGKTPEAFLGGLLKRSNPSANIGVLGVDDVILIITAIVPLLLGLVSTIGKAVTDAKQIDQSKADTSRLNPLTQGTLFTDSDWTPSGAGTGSNTGAGGGDNNNLLFGLGAVGLLGYAWYSSQNK